MNTSSDARSTRTRGTTAVATKGTFYHGNFDRLWPFLGTKATSNNTSETFLDPLNSTNYTQQGLQVGGVSDAITTTANTEQQQQLLEVVDESSSCCCCSSSSIVPAGEVGVILQPQHVDDVEYNSMGIDIPSSTNSKNSNDLRVAATQVPTNNNTKRSTTTIITTGTRFKNTFSCFQWNDMIHAIVSRSFYSLASILMIIMNKSIDKR